jgi:hypothetical protein
MANIGVYAMVRLGIEKGVATRKFLPPKTA